ncbi:MAG: MarR family transcriptional regulator [Firmicutes bacterium]|jgi:DNA-binding MarR family transcriptional regulator|nr:MarR family transcriptional regulator [Bacillota bacterium]
METNFEFSDYIGELEWLLRHVSAVIRKRGREILADFNITPPQLTALQVLQRSGNITIGELGEKMYLAYSTATDLIDRMERNELVIRVRDSSDRRVVRLQILPKGEKLVDEVIARRKTYLSGILEEVSDEDKIQLINSLKQLDVIMRANVERL